ncbi:conserved hypothetical protein [Photobacterium leiognathi lrivu.4.1]|uniref:Uncharacterized protein n=1 Tax=Photobacterium leiognathi lrivu.4.1 TaxID=1248232 RepID=V5H426_PHOLE|nr:conserved hypothetical protein [Photobacterium leiognathi lrivu.4.1]
MRAMHLIRHKILFESGFLYTIVNKFICHFRKKIEKKFLLLWLMK